MNTTDNIIRVSGEATQAIKALQHPSGTYTFYKNTLDRLFAGILHNSDELGFSDMEAMETLRALDCIRRDLAAIAAPIKQDSLDSDSQDEILEKIEGAFGEIQLIDNDVTPLCND